MFSVTRITGRLSAAAAAIWIGRDLSLAICPSGQFYPCWVHIAVYMSDDTDPYANQETIEASVTVTRDFAERLADQYSASLSLPEALRDAAEDAVTYREQGVAPEDITESTREALEQATPITVDAGVVEQSEE